MPVLNDLRQVQQNQQDVEANAPIDLVPNSTVDTSHPLFQFDASAAKRALDEVSQRTITPPSEANITKNMWLGSFMVGLSAALASGNAAGGITAGLWAAIAVHDGGYALRQRAEHVDSLLSQGYSFPAVLKWYEDGDNKSLEDEYKEMGRNAREEAQLKQRGDEFKITNERLNRQFNGNMSMQNARFGEQVRHAMAMEEAAKGAADRAATSADRSERRLDIQDRRQLHSEFNDTIKGAKQKQYYMRMADESIKQLRAYVAAGDKAGAAEAYHNVRNNLARAAVGGNASLTPEQMEGATGLPALIDSKANEMNIAVNGLPTEMFMRATEKQIADDIQNENKTLIGQGRNFYKSMVDSGYTPEEAQRLVTMGLMGTAIGPHEWGSGEGVQQPPAKQQGAPNVGDVIKGYRYKGGDPSSRDSWEKAE